MSKIEEALWKAGSPYLSKRSRKIVYLRRQGLTFGDISEKLGRSRSSVGDEYHRAKEKLYSLLESSPEHDFWDDLCGEVGAVEATAISHLSQTAVERKERFKQFKKRSKFEPPHLIRFFGLPTKTKNALQQAGVYTVFRIQEMTRNGFLALPNLNEKSLEHVIETLEENGFDASNLKE